MAFFQDSRISAILDQPDAPTVVAKLNSVLEAERLRRLQFYAEMDEDVKAEFINGEVVIQSPAKMAHTDATGWLFKLLDTYSTFTIWARLPVKKR